MTEYYSAFNGNGCLTPAATQVSLEHLLLSESSRYQRTYIVGFHLQDMSRTGNSREQKVLQSEGAWEASGDDGCGYRVSL